MDKRPQIVLEINQVLQRVKILKEHTIEFIDWMRAKGIQIGYGDLKNMDRVIAGKRLAEYYQEYRAKLKNVEKREPSSDWNTQIDADVKLDAQSVHKITGMPLPESMMKEYLAEMGEDRYSEIKSKTLEFISEHGHCTLRQLYVKIGECLTDTLVVCLILAQKGKISLWQNEPFKEVYVTQFQ